MADWHNVTISWWANYYGNTAYYLSVAGWRNIMSAAGVEGTAGTLADFGITGDGEYWSDSTPVFVCDDYPRYGLCLRKPSSYNSTIVIIDMQSPTVSRITSFYGGFAEQTSKTTARVLVGEDYWVATCASGTDTGCIGMASLKEAVANENSLCFFGRLKSGGEGHLFDLDRQIVADFAFTGATLTQNDGSWYCEIVKLMAGNGHEYYVSENVYQRFFDYATSEKVVIMNGLKFTSACTSELYFLVE